jgi:pilus assembly protein Flp/PilA
MRDRSDDKMAAGRDAKRGVRGRPSSLSRREPERGEMTNLYLRAVALFHRDEDGQGLAEYALILALIAIVAIVALIFLGGQTSKILSQIGKSI